MTFRQDDLNLAVEQGLISEAQAEGISRIAAERRAHRAFAAGREERLRFLGGFNDFFVAVGVVLLGAGLVFAGDSNARMTQGDAASRAAASLSLATSWTVATLIMWGLCELLTARLKLTAPSIVAVAFLGCFTFAAAENWLEAAGVSGDGAPLIATVLAAAMLALHYMRFRLPFTLLPLALFGGYFFVSLVGGAVSALLSGPAMSDAVMWWTVFAYGIIIFALAMRFDVSDPERLTTRADCGFWLHLIAAPMLVHPLVGPLFSGFGTTNFVFSTSSYAVMAIFTIALAGIALAIDRRALLISGLSYIGLVIGYTVTKLSGGAETMLFVTPLLLGILVIVLGVGWRTLRRYLLSHLPGHSWKELLPPYLAAKAP